MCLPNYRKLNKILIKKLMTICKSQIKMRIFFPFSSIRKTYHNSDKIKWFCVFGGNMMDENQNKLINQVKEEMQYVDAYQKAVKQRRKLSKENAMLERQADQLSLDKEILKGQINDVVAKIDSGQFGNISKKQIALDTTGYTATVDESESKKVGRRLLLWMILLEVVLLVISSVSGITSGNFLTNTTADGLKKHVNDAAIIDNLTGVHCVVWCVVLKEAS